MAKKELVITLVKTELVYEVQNKTHLTGVSRFAGDNFEQVANMQMGDDEEHKNQILRDCNLNSVQKTIYFVLWIETVKSTS